MSGPSTINHQPSTPSFYITGGTVPRDALSYVVRKADEDLLANLLEGRFCYVLTSRQMGKSSLMVRTAARLRAEGVTCAVLDITAVGQDLTREQWYDGLQNALGRQLGLEDELEDFWLSHSRLSPLQRWMLAVEKVVLQRIEGSVVLFIDEIDAVRSLPFSADEFFAAIREFYNRRTETPALDRLTFCLLGVASPSDLIRDTRTTPFNIGVRIDLTDFSLDEAAPLAEGLRGGEGEKGRRGGEDAATRRRGDAENPDSGTPQRLIPSSPHPESPPLPLSPSPLLSRNLYWTGGHPYLTQRLCQAVADEIGRCPDGHEQARMVDEVCSRLLVSAQARVQNDNLLFVRDRLLRSEVDVINLLQLYGRVLRGQAVPDDEADPLITVLKLSGVVRSVEGRIRVRNRIYSRVFDREWVTANMPDAELRRQTAAFRGGVIRASLLFGAVVMAVAALGAMALRSADMARKASARSRQYAARLEEANRRGNAARIAALNEAHRARAAEAGLQVALQKAREQRQEAVHQKREADRQKKVANVRRAEAESAHRETSEKLRDSYFAQAEASRWSGRMGQKYGSLAALARAAAFPASTEFRMRLRDEAIACMAIPIDLRLARQHTIPFRDLPAMCVSADRRSFATGDKEGSFTIRSMDDGRALFRGRGTGSPILHAKFSPSGRYLALSDSGNPVRVQFWDLDRKALAWKSDSRRINATAYGPDEDTLYISYTDGEVHQRNLRSGVETKVTRLLSPPDSLRVSPRGKWLSYIRRGTGLIQIQDLRSKASWTLEAPARLTLLAWSEDERYVAATGADNNVYVWRVDDRRLVAQMKGHLSQATDLSFLHGGRVLQTSGWDGSFRFWEVATGRQLLNVPISGYTYGFSTDGRRLYRVGRGMVQEFDVDPDLECRPFLFRGPKVYSIDFLRGTSLLATGDQQGAALWDVDSGDLKGSLHTGPSSYALFTPNAGMMVVYGEQDRRLTVRPLHVDNLSHTVTVESAVAARAYDSLEPVHCSADGRRLICGHGSSLSVLDLPRLDRERLLEPHPGISSAALSPDGRWAVSAGHHAVNTKVWDTATRRCVAELPTSSLTNVVFTPDGHWLVTGNQLAFQFWRVGTWTLERETPRAREAGLMGAIAFSPDGRQAALGVSMSGFELVDSSSGAVRARLECPADNLLAMPSAFSPDGVYFAAGTEAGIVYVWDLRRIRARLRAMGLDWDTPAPPPAPPHRPPLKVEIANSPTP